MSRNGAMDHAPPASADRLDRFDRQVPVSSAGSLDPALTDLVFRLARTPGHSAKAIDITRALSTTTTRTTRIIDEAERRGLAARAPHPVDRRAVLVSLTQEGLEAARRLGRVAIGAAQRHVHDHLSVAETATLEELLRRLRDRAATTDGDRPARR